MSRTRALPRLHLITNFNYFFLNTKRNLGIQQNFFANTFLNNSQKPFTTRRKSIPSPSIVEDDDFLLKNVASKVLTCQETGQESANFAKNGENEHIPFAVVAKNPTKPLEVSSVKSNFKFLVNPYIKLTKPNLTILVTLSSICSYAISPLSVSLPQLMFLTMGTALSSGAANAINMGREPEFDRKMPRTVGRPVVRGLVTPNQAYKFAAATGTIGCCMLYVGVNPLVAGLGFANIILYGWIYTSLKRKSIINTWVGAIVGAIPPLMGWAASSSLLHPGAWCLAGLLYAWQFPHFNALSHNIADQYKQAGYVMTAAENPKLNARVALRYSLLMFPLCFGLSFYGVTDWVFPVDSAIFNGWLTYLAYQFWRQQKTNWDPKLKQTAEGIALAGIHARKLFWCSVWHLPAVLILAMLHKKGQWERLFHYLGISSTEDEYLNC